jgi:hypothetical protein
MVRVRKSHVKKWGRNDYSIFKRPVCLLW